LKARQELITGKVPEGEEQRQDEQVTHEVLDGVAKSSSNRSNATAH
jgi:hypothetical protein